MRAATEGALWVAIRHHGLMPATMVISDGAGQFPGGRHDLCWVHTERLADALLPTTTAQAEAIGPPAP